jgi:protein TonB
MTGEAMVFRFKTTVLLGILAAAFFAGSAAGVDLAEPISAESAAFKLTKVDGPDPKYPSRAQLNKQDGWVDLRFTVTAQGEVEAVEVVDAKPRRVFERSALRAASKWVFAAPMDAGINNSVSGIYRVRFVSQ